jgi:hypothetical protein
VKATWHVVVEALYQGEGWWHIVLDCGHAVKVLHGATSPLGEQAKCNPCDYPRDRQRPARPKDLEEL